MATRASASQLVSVGSGAIDPHVSLMGAYQRHLFTNEIRASKEAAGGYTWAIRDHGKLFRRSDRAYASEDQARHVALMELRELQRAWSS